MKGEGALLMGSAQGLGSCNPIKGLALHPYAEHLLYRGEQAIALN